MIYHLHKLWKHSVDMAEAKKNKSKFGYVGSNTILGSNLKIVGGKYIELHDNVYIGPESRLEAWDSYNGKGYTPHIVLEEGVKINSKAHIGAVGEINIGKGTLLGSNVFITDHSHGASNFNEMQIPAYERDLVYAGGVTIGENCWICENVIILPNTNIGDGCIIGAGTIVQGIVPSYSVVVGVKGHIIKTLNQ